MPLFNTTREARYQKGLIRELMHNVIGIEVGVYKLQQGESVANLYNEITEKVYTDPIRIFSLPDVESKEFKAEEGFIDTSRIATFSFFEEDLEDADLLLAEGDIIEYDEKFYQVDKISDSNYWSGRNPNTSVRKFTSGSDDTGYAYATVAECSMIPEKNLHFDSHRFGEQENDLEGDITDLL